MAFGIVLIGTLTSLACAVYGGYKIKNQFTEDL